MSTIDIGSKSEHFILYKLSPGQTKLENRYESLRFSCDHLVELTLAFRLIVTYICIAQVATIMSVGVTGIKR